MDISDVILLADDSLFWTDSSWDGIALEGSWGGIVRDDSCGGINLDGSWGSIVSDGSWDGIVSNDSATKSLSLSESVMLSSDVIGETGGEITDPVLESELYDDKYSSSELSVSGYSTSICGICEDLSCNWSSIYNIYI